MKEFIDIKTQVKYRYNVKDIFLVYIRRSNGKPKLLYAGNSPSVAFDKYYSLKVFFRDRKYLKIKPIGDTKEHDILGINGVDKKPEKKMPAFHKCNYSRVSIRHISNIPETLLEEFKLSIDGIHDTDNFLMTLNRSISYLMAYFVSLTREQRKEFFDSNLKELVRHKILSGGDNTNQIKNFLVESQNEIKEEDELL
jgi:hypothetical protein